MRKRNSNRHSEITHLFQTKEKRNYLKTLKLEMPPFPFPSQTKRTFSVINLVDKKRETTKREKEGEQKERREERGHEKRESLN